MGARPQIIVGGLKTEKSRKIENGAYSSELITPEWKRISESLKRLWNHKTMAYNIYVRPWPLTPRGKHGTRFCMYKCKNSRFFAILSKFSAVTPRQTFTVNSPRGALQVWKILWTLTHKRRWTIRYVWKIRFCITSRLFTDQCYAAAYVLVPPPGQWLRISLERSYLYDGCIKKAWTSECI